MGPSGDPASHSGPSPLSAHAYCGQTVARLSNCWALVTIHRRHRRNKMMDQNFEIRILWFLRIFERRRAVSLQPIWSIMVAAKLDQSGVLVTKFHQNRLTFKGRSAGQRHTDTQTHRQTRLKIRALQVCNRAKNFGFVMAVNLLCMLCTSHEAC